MLVLHLGSAIVYSIADLRTIVLALSHPIIVFTEISSSSVKRRYLTVRCRDYVLLGRYPLETTEVIVVLLSFFGSFSDEKQTLTPFDEKVHSSVVLVSESVSILVFYY